MKQVIDGYAVAKAQGLNHSRINLAELWHYGSAREMVSRIKARAGKSAESVVKSRKQVASLPVLLARRLQSWGSGKRGRRSSCSLESSPTWRQEIKCHHSSLPGRESGHSQGRGWAALAHARGLRRSGRPARGLCPSEAWRPGKIVIHELSAVTMRPQPRVGQRRAGHVAGKTALKASAEMLFGNLHRRR